MIALGRLLHDVKEGRDVGVGARANVLDVEEENIDALQHLLGGPSRLAIERVDGNPALLAVFDGVVGVGEAIDAVLGCKQCEFLTIFQNIRCNKSIPSPV